MRTMLYVGLLTMIVALFALFPQSGNAASIQAMPDLDYTPEPNISINLFELRNNGSWTENKCSEGNTKYGCTAFCDNPEPEYSDKCNRNDPLYGYPYKTNSLLAPIQTYYLLDVISGEMDPRTYSEDSALRAQAIASRSFVWWFIENYVPWYGPIDNSNSFQVFVPLQFDKLNHLASPMEPQIDTPCHPDRFRNVYQEKICQAIDQRLYLSLWYKDAPAKAMFASDSYKNTLTYTDDSGLDYSYLTGIEDTISVACDADNDGGSHRIGMSQQGANRWVRGHQCSYPGAEPTINPSGTPNPPGDSWSVTWTRPEQILFHYYTSVQLRDASNDNKIISPDWRWNPLDLRWAGNSPQPPTMNIGGSYRVTVTLQNTGLSEWTCQGSAPCLRRMSLNSNCAIGG